LEAPVSVADFSESAGWLVAGYVVFMIFFSTIGKRMI